MIDSESHSLPSQGVSSSPGRGGVPSCPLSVIGAFRIVVFLLLFPGIETISCGLDGLAVLR